MRVLPFLMLMICNLSAFIVEGQSKRIQSVRIRKKITDTISEQNKVVYYLGLPSIKHTAYKTHLRVWSENNHQVIDI
jgi:hypothetical protein